MFRFAILAALLVPSAASAGTYRGYVRFLDDGHIWFKGRAKHGDRLRLARKFVVLRDGLAVPRSEVPDDEIVTVTTDPNTVHDFLVRGEVLRIDLPSRLRPGEIATPAPTTKAPEKSSWFETIAGYACCGLFLLPAALIMLAGAFYGDKGKPGGGGDSFIDRMRRMGLPPPWNR
jgi:hypothetical protein